jgi:hypothetical protein
MLQPECFAPLQSEYELRSLSTQSQNYVTVQITALAADWRGLQISMLVALVSPSTAAAEVAHLVVAAE